MSHSKLHKDSLNILNNNGRFVSRNAKSYQEILYMKKYQIGFLLSLIPGVFLMVYFIYALSHLFYKDALSTIDVMDIFYFLLICASVISFFNIVLFAKNQITYIKIALFFAPFFSLLCAIVLCLFFIYLIGMFSIFVYGEFM